MLNQYPYTQKEFDLYEQSPNENPTLGSLEQTAEKAQIEGLNADATQVQNNSYDNVKPQKKKMSCVKKTLIGLALAGAIIPATITLSWATYVNYQLSGMKGMNEFTNVIFYLPQELLKKELSK